MGIWEIIISTSVLGLFGKELVNVIFNKRRKTADVDSIEIQNESAELRNAFDAAKMWRENAEAFQKQLTLSIEADAQKSKEMSELIKEVAELKRITEDQTKEIVKLETKMQNLSRENKKLIQKLNES
jgi:uncharacterized coiled-coil DUF342 family protein